MFFCEYCKIFKNSVFYRMPLVVLLFIAKFSGNYIFCVSYKVILSVESSKYRINRKKGNNFTWTLFKGWVTHRFLYPVRHNDAREWGEGGGGCGGLLLMTFWKCKKISNFKVYVLLQPIYIGEVSDIKVIDKQYNLVSSTKGNIMVKMSCLLLKCNFFR